MSTEYTEMMQRSLSLFRVFRGFRGQLEHKLGIQNSLAILHFFHGDITENHGVLRERSVKHLLSDILFLLHSEEPDSLIVWELLKLRGSLSFPP